MSSTNLSYDNCTYKQDLKESVGPGDYMINTPTSDCKQCISDNPYIRTTNMFPMSLGDDWIDANSELSGRTRTASSCPSKKYLPVEQYNNFKPMNVKKDEQCNDFLFTEDTRSSNPACNLRGRGINRWEYLCEDPQKYALTPFDDYRYGVNNRLLVKDAHKPCIPKPLDTTNVVGNENIDNEFLTSQADSINPGINWRTCSEVRNL